MGTECAHRRAIPDRSQAEAGNRPNICTLHVAQNGRKGRHFIMFRVATAQDSTVIDVLRFLHDSMNLERHLPQNDLG